MIKTGIKKYDTLSRDMLELSDVDGLRYDYNIKKMDFELAKSKLDDVIRLEKYIESECLAEQKAKKRKKREDMKRRR